MNKNTANKVLTYAGIVLFLLFLAYAFVPQVLSGKVVDQSDISAYMGMSKEATDWDKSNPDDPAMWTDSMFGGMPTTMITGNQRGDWTKKAYDLMLSGQRPASYLFISLLGAFLLMLALGVSKFVALGGAIAITFCSYNMQIIQVGHNSKMLALAFLPWVLAAVIWTYRSALKEDSRKWLADACLGSALFALALDFQIKANHVQISYYLAIVIFCYVFVLLGFLLAKKRNLLGRFLATSALLLFLGGIGIAVNANKLIPTLEYTKYSMRGGSELSSAGGSSQEKSKGLDLDYATAWSYGWEELPNMMIPDYNGGSSAYSVNPSKSATIQLLKDAGQTNLRNVAKSLPLYWGPQPFTAGPMYMGAITIFLFILGLGLYRGKEKWWILAATLIGIFLSLGNHFMGFTEFWYYHIPFYSKFRTVSMALVILQFTLPVLAFLTLDKLVKGEYGKKEFGKWGLVALALSGGFCLLAYSGIGRTFSGASDASQPDILVEALAKDRLGLLRKDALTSLVFIVLAFLSLAMLFRKRDAKDRGKAESTAVALVCALVLINMYSVGKRYLNDSHFVRKQAFNNQYTERTADSFILQDEDPDFRVLDLSVNVFNDAYPSYFHKNIGGYSPVKLQRYQDLIDRYLAPEINSIYKAVSGAATVGEAQEALPELPILSMLNNKYIILDSNAYPVTNTGAMGSCFLVDSIARAGSPDEEIDLIGRVDLEKVAVVGKDFGEYGKVSCENSSDDRIELLSYSPNRLEYAFRTTCERTAVLSEIYYPDGWSAEIDGTPVKVFRANWTLRAVDLPAGEHKLTLSFEPKTYVVGSKVSRASSILLLLFLLLGLTGKFRCGSSVPRE